MAHSWLAYLPPHLAAELLAHPGSSPLDRVLRQQAIALFADISGFTPMSEALGQVGPKGTEELSGILNQTFGTMIGIIHSYGGSIGKFAGDAITVVFPFQQRTQQVTVHRALQCALDMQAAMASAAEYPTSAGTFRLTMKIGLGMGTLLTTTVGDSSIRLEYVLAGSAIDRCTEAEQHAAKGAVVICDDLLPFANACDLVPLTTSVSQVRRLQHRPCYRPPVRLPDPSADTIVLLARYLPPAIAERLEAGRQGFVDEHRTVTTMFVRFSGFDYQSAMVVEQLQGYLAVVVQICDRYGGYLRQVDVGDKGSLFIVLFGAPLAHEDDTERALLCALELRDLAIRLKLPTATGITTGRIFCGLVGSAVRREYAAIGDSVNLAARLMSAAHDNQILVDAATRQQLTTSFHWRELPPLTVKGKTAPIMAAALERQIQRSPTRLRAPGYTLPMVGRQAELGIARACLAQALVGRGQLLLITAEAGMGKSRLVSELLRHASSQPITYYTSECLSYGQQSYQVWHSLLRALFGLTSSLPDVEQIEQVNKVLSSIEPGLLERAPLLGSLLNLPIHETPLSSSLEGRVRQEALVSLVVSCIQHWTRQHALLLILEDCHWIDELSAELFLTIAQRCSGLPLLLLATYRPLEHPPTASHGTLDQLRRLSHAHELRLQEFSRAETEELISLKLRQYFHERGRVPPQLLDRISEQAQGNPFYIDELLNFLHDRGIDFRDARALEHIELPDSVQRLILSRIDRLAEGPKTALKVASIIGRLFVASWLWHLDPQLGSQAVVQGYLEQLQQLNFIQLERSNPELEYLFRHIIMREVTYESLAMSTRVVLHEQVGAFIEAQYPDSLDRYLDVLAYHYQHSMNTAKQREYYWRAGQAAKAAFANATATHYFEQLLTLLEEEERGPILVKLAEVLILIGRYDESEQLSHQALGLAKRLRDTRLAAQAFRLQGRILSNMGQYDAAFATLDQARAAYTALQDQHGLVAILRMLIEVSFFRGHYEVAIAESTACLELAKAIGAYSTCCTVLNAIGASYAEQEQWQEAIVYFERGIQLATEHNLRVELALLMGNLASIYTSLGTYHQAFGHRQHVLALALSIGYHSQAMLSVANLGVIYQEVGQIGAAERCLLAALSLMGEFPEPRWFGFVLMRLAEVRIHQGDTLLAELLLAQSIAIFRSFGVRIYLVMSLDAHAEQCMRQARSAEAEASTQEALVLATQLHIRTYEFKSRLRAIQLAILRGQLMLSDGLMQFDALQREWSTPEQQAAINYAIWQIDPDYTQARNLAAEQYRSLASESPRMEYRQRYRELTRQELPAVPPFPDPPSLVDENQLDIDEVLRRAERLLVKQTAPEGDR